MLLAPLAARGTALPPDSLNDLQKRTINRLAEVRLGNYMYLLKGLASFTGSDEAAVEAEEFIEGALGGAEPIFISKDAFIESNLDPEPGNNASERARTVENYLKEFRLMFRPEGDDPLEYQILKRAEPKVTDGRVHTSIQYEMRFNGNYEPKPGKPYNMGIRVAEFIAMEKGGGNWTVTIASDRSFVPDPAKPFIQYSVDRDLEAVERGMLAATPRLIQLRKEDDAAKKKALDVDARKKADYDRAIEEGDKALNDGDPEVALEMFGRAQEIDPISIRHVGRKTKAGRELRKKKQEEIDRALDQISTDLARQIKDNRIGSVAVPDFTREDGTITAMGKYLSEQVANRLATNGGFKVLLGDKAAKAKTEIRGRMQRTGEANDRVNLTATIVNVQLEERKGYAQKEFPVPQAFQANDAALPQPPARPEVGHWTFGVTAGLNLTRIADNDSLTGAFTVNDKGFRAGAEAEWITAKGNSRFVTGLRLSQLKCSTADAESPRSIDVVYLQLPLLFRLFSNETSIGRVGAQLGGLLDYTVHATTKSDAPDTFIEVSNLNFHASPGLCYEVNGPGGSRIVANVAYDLMLPGLLGQDLPKEGPRLHALSFAAGVMFGR